MKKLCVLFICLLFASAAVSLFGDAEDYFPDNLSGTWQYENLTLTVDGNKCIWTDSDAPAVTFEGELFEQDEKFGFFAVAVYKSISGEITRDNLEDAYFIFYVRNVTNETLEMKLPNSKALLSKDYIYEYHEDPSKWWKPELFTKK